MAELPFSTALPQHADIDDQCGFTLAEQIARLEQHVINRENVLKFWEPGLDPEGAAQWKRELGCWYAILRTFKSATAHG